MTEAGIPQQNRRSTEIGGRVHDPDRGAVPGAAVTLVDATGRQIGRGSTDSHGDFALRAPGRGSYVLITSAPSYQPSAVTVNVLDGPVHMEVSLTGAGGLRGVVRAATTGVPIMDAAVTVTDAQGDVVGSRLSGRSGEYAFTALAPGFYTLAVNAPGYRPTALAVTAGESGTAQQDVELADGAVIHGSIAVPDHPRPAVTVTLLDAGQLVRTTHADENGRYVFHDLDPGTYTVVATSYSPSRQVVRIADGVHTRHDVQLA